ncbi:MAG: class I SAM-dependent methyltransferase [Candidatus Woesearchaeota archaeon]|jgi:ubiquinone/menaquinone biosynthesis C-methylase UbiE/uncharacterized protein YbaR (Trm112 family)
MMSIINNLQCPLCKDKIIKEKQKLKCVNCKTYFDVKKGIINMLVMSDDVKKELNENQKVAEKRINKSDKWLLSLPLSDNFGNEKYPLINEGYKANVLQAIELVDFKGKKVLEIGSGTCWTTALLAEAGADVVATDISAEKYVGLESAEVFFKHKNLFFERVLCTMDVLPFQNEFFDIVYVNAAIHHAPDIKKTIKEITRVLKKDGMYIQTNEPCCSMFSKSNKINIEKARAAGMDVADNWNEQSYSLRQYKQLLNQNKFKKIHIFFPNSFELILNNSDNFAIKGYKNIIKKVVSTVWKNQYIKKMLSSELLFTFSLLFFGGNCIFIAKK